MLAVARGDGAGFGATAGEHADHVTTCAVAHRITLETRVGTSCIARLSKELDGEKKKIASIIA